MRIETRSVEETLMLGRLLGRHARMPPEVTCVALDGVLGAGKTHLTRGIALGAQVTDVDLVASPTYVLMNIYPGPKTVWHLDAYRVASEEDFEALGVDEILAGPGGIVVVEWAGRVAALLPADRLTVTIQHEDEGCRSMQLIASGPRAQALLEGVRGEWGRARQQAQQQQQ